MTVILTTENNGYTRTVADVLNSAKQTLNDEDQVSYTEAEKISFVVDALQSLRNMRPDLFLGTYATSIGALTTTSILPIHDQFFRPIVDYVIGRCETKDAEHITSGRAELMLKLAAGFVS